jgi:hypothetical protein
MALESISGFSSQFSLKAVLSGDPSVFMPLLYLAILIAIYSVCIWHFYRFVARRDCFKITYTKHAKMASFIKYTFAYPFVALLFFLGFSLMLLFLTRNYEIYGILSTSFAVVVAIRITAYYKENLSRDVAKMLPLALLGLALVEPAYFNYEEIIDKIYSLPEFFTLCVQFILLITLIEWNLRMLLAIKFSMAAKRRVSRKEHPAVSSPV